jgi:hypothetical protein
MEVRRRRPAPTQPAVQRDKGQATTEFVLLVALVSVPIWLAVRLLMQAVLRDFMTALVERFTRG